MRDAGASAVFNKLEGNPLEVEGGGASLDFSINTENIPSSLQEIVIDITYYDNIY